MCAMEAVAWIAGEPWSDAPQCASPVIAQFMRSWNDALPDADRTRVLMPLLPEIIGTRTTETDEQTRAWMAIDWAVRVYTPRWLREAGLTDHAVRIERLAPLVDAAAAIASKQTLTAARIAAHDAAWDAARAVAWVAAGAAAGTVAGAAAGVAAWDALAPTVAELQTSAQDLVRRMCAVGRVAAAEKEVANEVR
jgi:hypothetical protein